MENPLGLLRSQIFRLFSKQPKNDALSGENGRLMQALKKDFPWASNAELELIKKEKLYLDDDFMGNLGNKKPRT